MEGPDILVWLGVSEIWTNYLTEFLVVSCRLHLRDLDISFRHEDLHRFADIIFLRAWGFRILEVNLSVFLQLCATNLVCELYGALIS